MNEGRLDKLTKRLVEAVKEMGKEKMFENDEMTFANTDLPAWRELKLASEILREYAIGKRLDKIHLMLQSGEISEEDGEKITKDSLKELVELESL